MQRHKIVRKASVGVLLFLPLMAVGIALALMLSLGHQGAPTAQADDAKGSIDMSITATGPAGPKSTDCDTKTAGECSFPAGSPFLLTVDVNDVTGVVDQAGNSIMAGGYSVAQMLVLWDGKFVTGPDLQGSDKAVTVTASIGIPPANCSLAATAIEPGAVKNSVSATCNAGVSLDTQIKLGTGGGNPTELATVELNCDQQGTGFIVLINTLGKHPAGSAAVADQFGQPHFDKNGNEVLTINCLPENGQIVINKVDKANQGKLLAGSCWKISAQITAGSPPATINKTLDIVSDNNAVAQCETAEKADLSDKNPADGVIDIGISGELQLEFDTVIFSIEEFKAPPKYEINDTTKYKCTLDKGIQAAGTTAGAIGCEETNGGPFVVKNQQVNGDVTVQFEHNPLGLPPFPLCDKAPGVDFSVTVTGKLGTGDPDPNKFSTGGPAFVAPCGVKFNLPIGDYELLFQDQAGTESPCPFPQEFDTDKSVNPANIAIGAKFGGPQNPTVTFSCEDVKVLNLKTPGAANLFLTNQSAKQKTGTGDPLPTGYPPSSCRSGTDVALFTHELNLEPTSNVPKALIDPKTGVITPSEVKQRVAAFSMTVSVKPEQAGMVCLNIVPGDYFFLTGTGNNPFAGLSGQALVEKVQAFHDATTPAPGVVEQASLGTVACFINDVNDGSEPKGTADIFCVTKGKGFDRIEVSVGKADQFFKVDSINFVCQTTGELVAGTFKDHIKDANEGSLPHFEVWSGTFSEKCIGGVNIAAVPAEPSNNMVIKEAEVSNTTTGLTAEIICKNTGSNEWQCGDAPVDQTLPMAYILVKPDPDLYSLIKADQENGVVVQVLNSQCNFADNQGHEIPTSLCPDSDLTIRWLEGDVNADCEVNTIDQQLLAFRWGADFGSLLYDQRYDLVDTGVATINIKDVQFVFGRHGSKCTPFNQKGLNGPTHPPQLPVSKK